MALQASDLRSLASDQVVTAWLGTAGLCLLWTTGLCLRTAVLQLLLVPCAVGLDNQAGQRAQPKARQHWVQSEEP